MNQAVKSTLDIEHFEAGQVDAEQFDHEAHVHIGWLYLQRFDTAEAIGRFDSALRRLTEQLGVPDKYHATITWLFLLLINERSRVDESWNAFRNRNPELVEESGSTLRRYYSDAVLFSDEARKRFVLPDRLAL